MRSCGVAHTKHKPYANKSCKRADVLDEMSGTCAYSHAAHVVKLEEELPRELLERADVRLDLPDRCTPHRVHDAR